MANEILLETHGAIGLVRLNRPEVLNALNLNLMVQLVEAMEKFDADPNIICILLTGNDRAFGAGADINEMADASMVEMVHRNQFARWERLKRISKPIVASVSGYALGGASELMMICDIIVVAEGTRIGQPEINIGVMPGAGGTQRLTRAVGKAAAMDIVLTGRMLSAEEALRMGLISRVVPKEHCFAEALRVCEDLCRRPPLALKFAKEAVLKSYETTLAEGLEYERKLFYMLFATDDQKEGMRAFVEKRPPVFAGR